MIFPQNFKNCVLLITIGNVNIITAVDRTHSEEVI
jgi:hypothetical protein